MNYTQSDSYSTHVGTGHRMHDDSKAVPTAWSGNDANSVIWSLMQVLVDAGVSPASFDPSDPTTYNRLSQAIQILGGVRLSAFTGANQSLSSSGFQKLPGGLVLQWASVAFPSPPAGEPGETGTLTLPTTFPNACLHAFLSISVTSGAKTNFGPAVTALSASSVTWSVQEWSAGDNPGTLHVLAIGY